jgi:hypothetical protein
MGTSETNEKMPASIRRITLNSATSLIPGYVDNFTLFNFPSTAGFLELRPRKIMG